MLIEISQIVLAYFWGAVPYAYLIAWHFKGIDIREIGSGNAGTHNVLVNVGKLPALAQYIIDFGLKGVLPVFLAGLLEQSLWVQVGVGLASIAGHNWSLYMRFTGGRGVATATGVAVGLGMWPEVAVVTTVLVLNAALLKRDTGLAVFWGILIFPTLAYLLDRPQQILWLSIGVTMLLICKRLTANWESVPNGSLIAKVLLRRLLLDRDVLNRKDWITRERSSHDE